MRERDDFLMLRKTAAVGTREADYVLEYIPKGASYAIAFRCAPGGGPPDGYIYVIDFSAIVRVYSSGFHSSPSGR